MTKRGYDMSLLDNVIQKLSMGEPLDMKYYDHPLKGQLNDFRECHIQSDWILVYRIEKNILTLTLSNTGTHSDIFGG